MELPSTYKNCRLLYRPEISNWNTFEDWKQAGECDVLQAAREKCDRILKDNTAILLPADMDLQITNYLNAK